MQKQRKCEKSERQVGSGLRSWDLFFRGGGNHSQDCRSGKYLAFLHGVHILVPQLLQVYSDPQALQYVSGVAVHWYLDSVVPINVLDFTHDLQPDRFIFGSEACNGDLPWEPKVILGGWERGEKYAYDIIGVSLVYAYAFCYSTECLW